MSNQSTSLDLLLEQAENTPVAKERKAARGDLLVYLTALAYGQISSENSQVEYPVTHKLVTLGIGDDIVWAILHTEAFSDRFPIRLLSREKSEIQNYQRLVGYEMDLEQNGFNDVIPAMNPADMTKPGILVPAFVYKENLSPVLLALVEEKIIELKETNSDLVI